MNRGTKAKRSGAEHVVFVTRRFPPSVGGMQTLAADVDRSLRRVARVELVALRYESTRHLVWFLPYAVLRVVVAVARGNVTRVVCGDGIVWAAVGPALARSAVKSTVMVHGLDLSFPNRFYQRWIRRWLPRADRVVANSAATATAVRIHGVDEARVRVMNPGIRFGAISAHDRLVARAEVVRSLALDEERLVAVTVGRLVRRKGVHWFIEEVMPHIQDDLTYLVVGDGPMREEILAAVARTGLGDRVHLLGHVDDDRREILLRGADLFVMPNVRVSGDMEGFGLVAAEAATRGALVIASALEGITDAVVDGSTGILVEPEQPERYVEVIRSLARDRDELDTLSQRCQLEARERFSIERMEVRLSEALGL